MKLDEDFSDIKQRILINIKTRNLYFKTFKECEKLLDIQLIQLQEKGAIPTEDLYKSELRNVNNYIEDYSNIPIKNKLFELVYYFLLITFAGLATNLIKNFLGLEFINISVSAVIMYLTMFAAVIATPIIISRKEKRFHDNKFRYILIAISAIGIILFSYFSIFSGPVKQNLFTINIFVYILILVGFAFITILMKKLSTK
ncbi:MAG: hypothetical protein E6Y73_03045 [Finegoldia magna]|nr:hypothetical protein [Finegoldia magna]MDU7385689.1 hypothetical protein [Finegoldia magna]